MGGGDDRPPPSTVRGFLGQRNLENQDILGVTVTGPAVTKTGQPGPGNLVNPVKGVINAKQDTLRPMFGLANPTDVIPGSKDQIRSDLLFEDFSVVAPGHGLGINNKMFLLEEARDKHIVYREPLCEPRKYDGPSGLVIPPLPEWQNEIPKSERARYESTVEHRLALEMLAVRRVGTGSLNTLGDDYGQLKGVSDKGLVRPPDSPLEPVLRRPAAMERLRPPTGQQLQARSGRRLFDALRYPERWEKNMAMEGGPTMLRPRAFSLLPFAVSMA